MEDDEIRRITAGLLIDQMGRNARLLDRCEVLAERDVQSDTVLELNAAARLTRASAAVAAQLARFAHIETRHRNTTEFAKPINQTADELNRKKDAVSPDQMRQMLLEKIQRLVAAENGDDDDSEEEAEDAQDGAGSRA